MDPHTLSRRDLRRLVSDMWPDERCDAIAMSTLNAAIAADAQSLDRSVLMAYLRHFPRDHPSFEALRAASAMAADRRDWLWRTRGERWQLWDATNGPDHLARALLASDDPGGLLREAGLDGDLAQGEYVADAVEAACEEAGNARGERAEQLGSRLITLFDRLGISGMDAMLAWALLAPWVTASPDSAYRNQITRLLSARIGDPRLDKQGRWLAVMADMPKGAAKDLLTVIKRWLNDLTVREFFKVVALTTDDPVQWAAREAFWLGYLDAGLIEDAWFALGKNARKLIYDKGRTDEIGQAVIEGSSQYANPSHSSLILSIGDERIAEWSHSGACRFWDSSDRTAPIPYQEQYWGIQLRAMNGGDGFETVWHRSGWQRDFANRIYARTGRRHPKW